MIDNQDKSPRVWMLVEDNPADAKLLMMTLKNSGCTVEIHWLTNGEEAIAFALRKSPYESAPRPALAILDLNLPRFDGIEILTAIRENPETEHIPVVLLTSSTRKEDVATADTYPGVTFISKPRELPDYEIISEELIRLDSASVMQAKAHGEPQSADRPLRD